MRAPEREIAATTGFQQSDVADRQSLGEAVAPVATRLTHRDTKITLALAGDALADAARLIAVNGLLAESAVRRGDGEEAFAKLRIVADALDGAREIVALAGRICQ